MSLPRDIDLPTMPALEAITLPADGRNELDLATLTRILFCANGLTRQRKIGGEDYHFRAAASAGALYPIETYIAATKIDGMEDGLYHFSPADLKVQGLRRGDWREVIARAAGESSFHRESERDSPHERGLLAQRMEISRRAYRYCFWDSGTILANLLAAAAAEGIRAEVITAFVDADIETLIGVDCASEGAMCLVALGSTGEALAKSPTLTRLELDSIELSKEVVYQPLVKMHRESRLESREEVAKVASAKFTLAPATGGEPIRIEAIEPADARGLGETILRRGSARTFAHEAIGADELMTILSTSSGHANIDFPRLTDTYLIVNAVYEVATGAYYFNRETNSLELLGLGDFRTQAGYLCLEQQLGYDCSALIVYMADLDRALEAMGNRGYRDAHLEAGIMAGRAYLASYALDRGATGLTFYDDDTTKFFSPHGAGKSPLLMVAVGVPHSSARTA